MTVKGNYTLQDNAHNDTKQKEEEIEGKKKEEEGRRGRERRINRDGLEGKSVISNRMGIAINVEYE